jgi:hypothetical protein
MLAARVRVLLGFSFTVGASGCVVDQALKVGDAVPRAISEASRKQGLAPYAGRYTFSECRADAPTTCFTYDIDLDSSSGTATIRADGPDLAIHVLSDAEAEEGGVIKLPFRQYIDGNPDDSFFHLPFEDRPGFHGYEMLGKLGHDRDGHRCLVFEALKSPLGSRWVCAAK